MKKKVLFLVLCIAMVCICAFASADIYSGTSDGYKYEYDTEKGTSWITGWTGSATELTIPTNFFGYRVISISSRVFEGTGLKKVTLPDNLVSIGYDVFDNVTTLQCHANSNTATVIGNFVTPTAPEYVIFTRDNKVAVVKYNGSDTSVTIPSSFDGVPVDSIANNAFDSNSTITSVVIPAGTTSIGDGSFQKCGYLASVKIPTSVNSIGYRAFADCNNLATLDLPKGLATLGGYALAGTGIKDLVLPDGLSSIGYGALDGISIVRCHADSNAAVLIGEFITPTAPDYFIYTRDGIVAVTEYFGNETTVTIPSSFDGVPVDSIANNAFDSNSTIKSVKIPAGTTSIGDGSFQKCGSLASVEIPASVTNIGYRAFADCNNLATLDLPEGLATLGGYALAGTGIKDLVLPNGLSSIGYGALDGISIVRCHADSNAAVLIGRFVTPTAPDFFVYTRDNKIAITGYVGKDTTVTIPSSIDGIPVDSIANNAFDTNTSIVSVVIPDGTHSIGDGAFANCGKLVSVKIPSSVTNIGYHAFAECGSLGKVEIPKSVTSIGGGAFPKMKETLVCDCDTEAFKWARNNGYADAEVNPKAEYKYQANHLNAKVDAGVNPTPTETGLTEGKHCDACNTVIIEQEELPKVTLDSAAFAVKKATVGQKVSITATTSTSATTLKMYSGSTLTKSWTTGYKDEDDVRTWSVTYSFTGKGSKTLTFKAAGASAIDTDGKKASITITAKPTITSVSFSRAKATVKQKVTITAVTSTTVSKFAMYSGSSLVKTWTTGYTDEGTTRTWKVTYAFSGKGNKTLTFKGTDANGVVSAAKTASITVTAAPTLTSVKFAKTKATVKQKVTITAVTSTNTTKLAMYNGSKAVTSWTTGYTDSGTTRTWKVTYAFSGTGKKTMSFKAVDANGYATAAKTATITITAAPTLTSVKFNKSTAAVKQNVTITAVTSKNTTKLTMYNGSKAVKSWTTGYTDGDTSRTWKVTYAFSGTGKKTMSFKAIDANGYATAAKTATITISSVPTLSSVEFGTDSAAVKKNVKIIAVTSTTATKLTMYNGTKEVKTWTEGYTDSGSIRTWKVTYAFTGTGVKTMTFKAGNAAGMSAGQKAVIEITK